MLGPNLLDALDTPQSVPTLQGGTWTALLPTRGWVAAGTLERGWNLIQPIIVWLICWGALLRHLEFHAGLRCWTGPFLWQGPPQIKTLFIVNSLCIFMRASHMWFVAAGWHEQIMCPPTFSWLKEIIGKGGHLKGSWTCNPYPKHPFITAMSVFAIFGHNPQTWKPLKWIETRCLVAILVHSSWVLARMCITTMGYPESLLWDFATSDRLLVHSFQHKRSKFTLVSVVSLCPAFFMLC